MVEIPIRKLKMAGEITLRDFWYMLSEYDWSFQYSDDHRQWDRGRRQRDEIGRVLKFQVDKDASYKTLYDKFAVWWKDPHGDVTKPGQPKE
jgi:hypothetical protein